MPPQTYLVIEGPIGVGKTTLARLLQPQFEAQLVLEAFEENPFLSDFYADRAAYAFQTQLFFLLSRYRQQQRIGRALPGRSASRSSLISDYTFAKDRLFAQLNLRDDELTLYDHLHDLLAQNIPQPDLVIYLFADTEILLQRIASRDRPYEREMDRDYLDAVRRAYISFFGSYRGAPVLPIDTNGLDIVRRSQDLDHVSGRIRSVLREGTYQPSLPQFMPALEEADRAIYGQGQRRLVDYQRWHRAFDEERAFETDLYINYILFAEEVGELARELTQLWRAEKRLGIEGVEVKERFSLAAEQRRPQLESELSDCLAYLLKLANYLGIDLEEAYLAKMRENESRNWDLS
jgi:deoxyadenosine/deoxycytidine kinase/NTP pyrophosphatase (non-canonical NTP hydrolase)